MGDVSVAAAVAGLTVVMTLCAWMMYGGESAHAALRPSARGLSVFGTIHPPLLGYQSGSLQADLPPASPVRLASLETDRSLLAPATTATLFDARFSPDRSAPRTASLSFEQRFGAATASIAPPPATATAAVPAAPGANGVTAPRASRAAAAGPAPRPAARSVVAQGDVNRPPAQYRLASLSDPSLATAYAPADEGTKDSGGSESNPLAADMSHTAIYDISSHTVYLPNGERLEAHSGLGGYMDDVRSVHLKSRGPTPPNVYELSLRERPFHGVRAIRLTPVDGTKMYGREGILAHPFMLGPDGQSNGCVSLKDYPAFLNAYRRGEITRLVVVEQLDNPPGPADWVSNALKRIFGRS